MADDIGSELRLGLSGISTSTGAIVEALPRISASHYKIIRAVLVPHEFALTPTIYCK
jgi:hypothetical protein